jgi:hypothetical protein
MQVQITISLRHSTIYYPACPLFHFILRSKPSLILKHLAIRARYFRCGQTLFCVRVHVILCSNVGYYFFGIIQLRLQPVVPL